MALAEIDGNQDAFRAAHDGTIDTSPFRDTLDGRGLGRFVYRVRSVEASGNASEWSAAFPLVEVRDITPPKTPTLVAATAFDNTASLTWLANGEPDLLEYRDMITIIRDRIQDGVKRGQTLAQVKAGKPTLDYDARWGATSGFWTTDMFIEAVYKDLSKVKK